MRHDGIHIAIVTVHRDPAEIAGDVTTAIRRRLAPLGTAHTDLRVHPVEHIPRPDPVSGRFKLIQALNDASETSTSRHDPEGLRTPASASVGARLQKP